MQHVLFVLLLFPSRRALKREQDNFDERQRGVGVLNPIVDINSRHKFKAYSGEGQEASIGLLVRRKTQNRTNVQHRRVYRYPCFVCSTRCCWLYSTRIAAEATRACFMLVPI